MNFKKKIIMTLYVDDVLITNHNKIVIKRIKNVLNVKFYMLNLKLCAFYLNIIIKRNRHNNIIRLKQKAYIIYIYIYFFLKGAQRSCFRTAVTCFLRCCKQRFVYNI